MFVRDALSGRMVAFSSKRSKRPHRPTACPFCPGHEHLTPPATLELPVFAKKRRNVQARPFRASGKHSASGWSVRVFPNAFPILSGRDGRHEVIVETDRHGLLFEDFSEKQLGLVFRAYQHRFRALFKPIRARYVLLFKNFGDRSGASIPHEHSQILSFPFIPDAVATRLKNWAALEADLKLPALLENDFFKAVCPTGSIFPYQVRVLAKDPTMRFEESSSEQGVALLLMLQAVIRKIKQVQGAPDYTLAYHAAPKGKRMRFFVDVLPRKSVWGGVELGSGVLVNFKEPKLALEELKKA